MDEETRIRVALEQHWAASDAGDFDSEHSIYQAGAILEYPQSGERIRGRANIQTTRTLQPNRKRFTVQRIVGRGDLWVTEYILAYDAKPSFTVSIMEFQDGKVARETQYFSEPFEAAAWRKPWTEQIQPAASASADAGKCHRMDTAPAAGSEDGNPDVSDHPQEK